MKRREFSTLVAGTVAVAALWPELLLAQGKPPQDGVDFLTLDKRVNVDAPAGKVEVIEFFWYSCPHCNAFEPKLEAWIKKLPADVVMRRIPVGFRDEFVPQQRLYYTLEALGKLDELHGKVFRAIHQDRLLLNREDLIVAWIEKQGVDVAKFRETYNSFGISSKARRATQIQDAFKVDGVPAIGIQGRYYTDASLAGNMDKALQVTDYLMAQVRKGA
ncbi:thiol:disulfide interchange protein DsbA/DsbL [Caenimonas koreensis]|uniref:Thiol:disulfide interchange protein n=1 Tax=Caenimonas koreensis DSM 17982 TaxID=1121255 RepID=A0A844AXF1_9BURK|nr:thiol:disulfide interchange protein DsbA/DsbL [Caenimonas koreensis]MRD49220.1 thioredoxin domain-containing protein [Caenimonas koreensis DSM 17982]